MPANGETFRDQDAAPRTDLARECRTAPLCTRFPAHAALKAEDGEVCRPARIGDALGEEVIPEHIGASASLRDRSCHSPSRAPARFCDGSPVAGGAPSDAPWRSSATALRRRLLPFLRRETRRCAVLQCAVRLGDTNQERRCASHPSSVAKASMPKVYPSFLTRGWQRLHRNVVAGETDIPAIRFPRDRDRLRGALHRPTPWYCNAPDLGEDQKANIQSGATVVPDLWGGEAVVAISAMEAGIAGCGAVAEALKVRLKRRSTRGTTFCKTWALTSAYSGIAFLISGNSAFCLK